LLGSAVDFFSELEITKIFKKFQFELLFIFERNLENITSKKQQCLNIS